MRLKFILVGFVLGLFVFPYVLNIGEAEAQVGVKCINFKKPPKRLQCFRQKVRKKNLIIKDLQKKLHYETQGLMECMEDLHTVEPPRPDDHVMEHNLPGEPSPDAPAPMGVLSANKQIKREKIRQLKDVSQTMRRYMKEIYDDWRTIRGWRMRHEPDHRTWKRWSEESANDVDVMMDEMKQAILKFEGIIGMLNTTNAR